MIFFSTLAFVVFLAVLPVLKREASSGYSFLDIFGKGTMYVLAIFTQHGIPILIMIMHYSITFFFKEVTLGKSA